MNLKSFISGQLKKTFVNKYNVNIGDSYFNVTYVGNHGIDYSMQSLFKLRDYLKMIGIIVSNEELFNVFNFESEYFEIALSGIRININLTTKCVNKIFTETFDIIKIKKTKLKKKVIVDFSSPNIAKDMHVGHLRSTIIGDSICKLYESEGHDVMRINHIGDFGLQFGMLIQHLFEVCPEYKMQVSSISDLQKFYAESKKRFDTDELFNKNTYDKVVKLQSGDTEIVNAWNFIKDISRKAYNDIYDRLDVYLCEVGESFYQEKIPDLIKDLEQNGLLCEEEGRKIIKLDGFRLSLTVVKSDGGFTYDTTDLAAIKFRLVDLNADKIIYVVDVGQSLHFEMLFAVAQKIGWLKSHQSIKHVGFGLVLDENGKKFKSRSGDTIKLNTLLDESLIQAKEAFNTAKQERSKNQNVNVAFDSDEEKLIIKNIAYGSIKYADLSTLRTNNYKFSFDKMLSFKGNTWTYQLYEYVRICSVLENAGDFVNRLYKNENNFIISEKEEVHICKIIFLFPEIIEKLFDSLMFHILCNYLYDLTNAFGSFHTKCRCLHYDANKVLVSVNYSRLAICVATKNILKQCFNILGLNKLKRM